MGGLGVKTGGELTAFFEELRFVLEDGSRVGIHLVLRVSCGDGIFARRG